MLVSQPGIDQTYDEALGVTYAQAHDDPDEALHRHRRAVRRAERERSRSSSCSARTTPTSRPGTELSFNARVAANLGSAVVLVVHGRDRTPDQIRVAADGAITELRANHAQTVAVVANRVDPADLDAVARGRWPRCPFPVTAAMPENPLLSAPTLPRARRRDRRASSCWAASRGWTATAWASIVAAMSLPNVLARLGPDVTVIAPSDRTDLIPGLMLAHQSGTFPTAGRHHPHRRLPDPRDHRAAVGRRAAGPADRAHRRRHLPHGRAAHAGARPDDEDLAQQDRDGAPAVLRERRPGGAAARPSTCRPPRCARR